MGIIYMDNNEKTIKKIQEVLEQLRPELQMDGGDVEFVKFENGVVHVKFLGCCHCCPSSAFTLKAFIEENLKENVSEVKDVVLAK